MRGLQALTGASEHRPHAAVKPINDSELLDRIVNGDRRALEALFARHYVRIYRFAKRMVGDEALAEDIVSDVFIDVWRNASRFDGNSQVTTWILGIARFKALSLLRRHREDSLDDATAEAIPDTADDPEVAAQKSNRVAILRECMSHLSPAHREIIDLVYYREKSIDEAAGIIGAPSNTVKTRVFHARKRMSGLLRQAGVDRTYQYQTT
jgi:RNA polymerase sigma-70 factor (ECF subfamily)